MKKTSILFLLCLFPVIIFAQDQVSAVDPEKYFSQAAVAYMEGNLDDATVLVMRALQLKPDNARYSALYDLILKEKTNVKEISVLPAVKKPRYMNDKQYMELLEYIRSLEKNIRRQAELSRNRAENTIILLSERAGELEKNQDKIVTEIIPEHMQKIENITSMQEKGFDIALYAGAAILFFILTLLFVIIIHLKNLKKAEESIKFIKARQDEQYQKLTRMEEEQRRLSGRP